MAKRRKPKVSGVLAQAQLESAVRYQPEAFQLSQLLGQARTDYNSQVRIEKGTAAGVKSTARAQLAPTRKNFNEALSRGKQLQSTVDAKLAPLSSAADDIKAASAVESAGAARRIGESKAGALNEFRQRVSQADSAKAYGISNAKQQYLTQRANIDSKLIELGQEQGTFTIAQADALRKQNQQFNLAVRGQNKTFQAAKLRVKATKRGQNITRRGQTLAHQDRQTANAIKRQNAAKKPKGLHLTPGQQNAAVDQINQARSFIQKLEANPKLNSHQIRQTLEQGYTTSSKGGKPGTKIPAFPHDVVNAAYDLFVFGHLSAPNVHTLRQRKIKIPKGWLPRGAVSQGVDSAARAIGSIGL